MKIAVTSRSFSANKTLRSELEARAAKANATALAFNETGASLRGADLAGFLQDADRAIIALEPVDLELLEKCPRLRVIGKYGVGLNNIDLAACKSKGVEIGWTAGVNRQSVAEMTVSLIIAAQRRLFESNKNILAGKWGQLSGRQLSSSTVGIIGFGHVGQTVANLVKPFGAKILINDIIDFGAQQLADGIEQVDFHTLLRSSDVVTLHVPSTPLTRGLINAEALAKMKPDAVLINTARGDVVVESALKAALSAHDIFAAAIDVFDPEPPSDAEFLNLPNLIATSHLGGSSQEAILAMGRAAIDGLFSPAPAERFIEEQSVDINMKRN